MQPTIKSKITLGLGFLFLIILLLSSVGGYFLYRLTRSTEATLHDNYRSVGYASRLADALADLRTARLSAGLAAEPAAAQARQLFERYIAAEKQNITEPGEGVLADSLATGFGQFAQADPAAAESRVLYQRLRQQVARVAALNLSAIERQSQRTRTMATRTITTLGLLAALGILATFSFIFAFPDYVTKPVEELTHGIRRLAVGDYTERLSTPEYQEFAEVARAFNDMASKLQGYETPEGTPHIDSTGPLDVVATHRRPGNPPAAQATQEQQRLVQRLRNQTRQLQATAEALLAQSGA